MIQGCQRSPRKSCAAWVGNRLVIMWREQDNYVGNSQPDCRPGNSPLHFAAMIAPQLLSTLALFMCLSPVSGAAQAVQRCDEERVTYKASRPSESQFRMEKVASTMKPLGAALDKSPQGTRWISRSRPDYTKNGPWSTAILVSDHQGAILKLTFPDHASGGVQSDWLNEKLLFLRVWLGRIVSLDLIVDVEKGSLFYSEEANYVDFIEPCE